MFETELKNISNLTFQGAEGRINFINTINISTDADFDAYMNISKTRIQIDTTNLTFLNQSARIEIPSLTLTTPRILFNNNTCPTSICTETTYSASNTLTFTVTQFSTYDIEESATSSSGSTTSASGGGGGGGGTTKKISSSPAINPSLEINPIKIHIQIPQGGRRSQELKLKNIYDEQIEISIDLKGLGEFLSGTTTTKISLTLDPGEEQSLNIEIFAQESTIPEIYTKSITVKENGNKQEIPFIIEVESIDPLFDIFTTIEDKEIVAGEDFIFQVTIINVKTDGELRDANLTYELRTLEGEMVLKTEETRAVERQITYIKSIRIPEDIEEGDYILYIKADTNGNIASASEIITIQKKAIEIETKKRTLTISLILLGIIAITAGYFILRRKKQTVKILENEKSKKEKKEIPKRRGILQ